MTVAILGRSKWEWGKGDVFVLRIDDRFFAQTELSDDQREADEVEPTTAIALLTGRGVRLTTAGRDWMKEQRGLRAKYQQAERKK